MHRKMRAASRKRSSLMGLLKDLIVYDPENPDHSPIRPVRAGKHDAEMAALPKQLASILRHREHGELLDEGGWMDIHTA